MRSSRSMGSLFVLAAGALVAAALAATALWAQSTRGPRSSPLVYNVATETTAQGSVAVVSQATGRHGWSGTHIQLQTESGAMDVHLGPTWNLQRQNFAVAVGDQLTITGSRVQFNGKDTLLARQIVRDGHTLSLRDARGFPLWSRQGRN